MRARFDLRAILACTGDAQVVSGAHGYGAFRPPTGETVAGRVKVADIHRSDWN
jgi:hypothetical protein